MVGYGGARNRAGRGGWRETESDLRARVTEKGDEGGVIMRGRYEEGRKDLERGRKGIGKEGEDLSPKRIN